MLSSYLTRLVGFTCSICRTGSNEVQLIRYSPIPCLAILSVTFEWGLQHAEQAEGLPVTAALPMPLYRAGPSLGPRQPLPAVGPPISAQANLRGELESWPLQQVLYAPHDDKGGIRNTC